MTDTKILVIDNDLAVSDLIKNHFESEGYEVKCISDGSESISTFKVYEPDIVLLDIMLPRKDGWQVCREIREISNRPIIMISAKSDIFDKVLGLELGADDYLVKPFDFDELLARIRVMTRKKSGSRSNLFTYTNLIVVTAEQSEAGKQNLFMINLSDRLS